jgi:signal peptidase II
MTPGAVWTRWSPKARVFYPTLSGLLVADWVTKRLAETYLHPEHTPHSVVGSVVRLTLTHNRGAAMNLSFGMYSRVVFAVVALVALYVLARLYRATPHAAHGRAAALALVIGGAAGNLLDRLGSAGAVTDFIDIGIGSWRFWTFNLADAGVTTGAALLFFLLWREERSGRQ